jgi:hypothetical protein
MLVFPFILGVVMVVSVLGDQMNTLVSSHTASHKWWLSNLLTTGLWALLRVVAARLPEGRLREGLLALYPPLLILTLLIAWVSQQVIGFALIWSSLAGVDGAGEFFDYTYYSGIVFFSVGFGEIVPVDLLPRFGAVVEAFSGVITIALVIAYLPSLYNAYSERERKLMTLDAGTEERIRPAELVTAWSPDADVGELLSHFASWEDWVAGVIETHTSFPMLMLFRSHHRGQSWITALGLVCDAALLAEMIVGAKRRSPYWMLRRSIRLLQELTPGVDLSAYRAALDERYARPDVFEELYAKLKAHGFELMPLEEARTHTLELRRCYDAQLEFMIERLVAPRGFWGHEIGHVSAPFGAIPHD